MELPTYIALYLSLSSLVILSPLSQATPPSGTIQRTTGQQVLATIPPNSEPNSQPFLTSTSGNSIASLLRSPAAQLAGDLGIANDSCYVQVQDAGSDQNLWESDCAPVSSADECALVLSSNALEVFDGSQPVWVSGANGQTVGWLELGDEGDLQATDEEGVVVWKASDEPSVNSGCGSSPVMSPAAAPPSAAPVGGDGNPTFGQPAPDGQQTGSSGLGSAVAPPLSAPASGGGNLPFGVPAPRPNGELVQPQGPVGLRQQPGQGLKGLNQASGTGGLPLVDNTPFDSGSPRGMECWFGLGVLVVSLFYGFVF